MNWFEKLGTAGLIKVVIGLAYIVLGITVELVPTGLAFLEGTARIIFGIVLMLYGAFRIYRTLNGLENE